MQNKYPLKIRASSLPSWPDCPRRGATRLLKHEITEAGYTLRTTPNGIGAIVGTSAHEASNYVMTSKKTGLIYNLPDAENIAIEKYREQLSGDMTWDETTPNSLHGEKQIAILVKSFIIEVAPTIDQPENIECLRTATIMPEIINSGTSDTETAARHIYDWKYGSKKAFYHGQLGDYSLLQKTHSGQETTAITMCHMPRVPIKKTYPGATIYRYDVGVCERIAASTIHAIIRDVTQWRETLKPETFISNPMSMLCSPKYCAAHGTEFCEITKSI